MDSIYNALIDIVGSGYVSKKPEELFFYSRDQGTSEPRNPDFVVMPRTTEEVQRIVILANEKRLPIIPMGGSLTLSGLCIPHKKGIVLDLKRMSDILEVNEMSRYALIEAGVSQGALQSYLARNHPKLMHSIPDAPPANTVAGNILIYGSGHLSQEIGFHAEMLNGLEVVLPTGEICRTGSGAVAPKWFARGPLPDLAGLFLGWFGTTGVVTKLSIRLFPKPLKKDVLMFVTEDPDHIPDVIYRITGTKMAEDVTLFAQPKPDWAEGFQQTVINITGDSEEEMSFKRRLIRKSVEDYIKSKEGGFMLILPQIKPGLLEAPLRELTRFADIMKGGGFEYVGSIIPTESFPQAYYDTLEIAEKYRPKWSIMCRVIGRGHAMMFAYSWPFNRADSADIDMARKALNESNISGLNNGGVIWKSEIEGQRMMMERMDSNTLDLLQKIKRSLDPNGIMNPGNWEVN
jgi:FAD/FMN-containing dehydrogenase